MLRPEEPASNQVILYAKRGGLVLPKGWTRQGDVIIGPDDVVYPDEKAAYDSYMKLHGFQQQVSKDVLQQMKTVIRGADADVVEVGGAIITTNQLDDWLHRGSHKILEPMSLYVYSMWVYRVERSSDRRLVTGHVDIPFDLSYAIADAYMQRLSMEERVPKIDGFQPPPPREGGAGTVNDFEMNAMFKSLLLRPVSAVYDADFDSVKAFAVLHARPVADDVAHPWAATRAFSGAWYAFESRARRVASAALSKSVLRQEGFSFWETCEVQDELDVLADVGPSVLNAFARVSMEEYVSHIAVEIAANLDGIAWARVSRKERPAHADEGLVERQGDAPDGRIDGDAAETALASEPGLLRLLPSVYSNGDEIMRLIGRVERTSCFTRTFEEMMSACEDVGFGDLRGSLRMHWAQRVGVVQQLVQSLLRFPSSNTTFLAAAANDQATAFKERGQRQPQELTEEAPTEPFPSRHSAETPFAFVEPMEGSILPSAYIAARISAQPLKMKPSEEQLRFLAVFGTLLDKVREEERNGIEKAHRSTHMLLLLGQGGSGKTHVVQQYVAPAVRFAFESPNALRMCAFSNAQATNLSTNEFHAVTLHNACSMGVQSLLNKDMYPKAKLRNLEEFWGPCRCLVLEEFSLCPAEGYNMGLWRSAWGRRDFVLDINEYATHGSYWGGVPLVLHLGDFLQLRPPRAISLLDSKDMLLAMVQEEKRVSREAQLAIAAFKDMDYVFSFVGTKRFKDTALPEFLQAMRDANPAEGRGIPDALWRAFSDRVLTWADASTKDEKTVSRRSSSSQPKTKRRMLVPLELSGLRVDTSLFQSGHEVAIYWETVIKWFYRRARRDARRLGTTLFWCQAGDAVTNINLEAIEKRVEIRDALQRCFNIHTTGHLHSMLPLHVGMRVRLTEKLSAVDFLVQDAEGTLVALAFDESEAQCAPALDRGEVVLSHVLQGAWVRMDNYVTSPLRDTVADVVDKDLRTGVWKPTELDMEQASVDVASSADGSFGAHLLFVPSVTRGFRCQVAGAWRHVTRRQVPLTSAVVRTAQSSQGLTFRQGVTCDLARRDQMEASVWWLNIYVMLSRATAMMSLAIFRAPSRKVFEAGPPSYLLERLAELHAADGSLGRTVVTSARCLKELGWSRLCD